LINAKVHSTYSATSHVIGIVVGFCMQQCNRGFAIGKRFGQWRSAKGAEGQASIVVQTCSLDPVRQQNAIQEMKSSSIDLG
jgi:hypothetical protein